MNLAHVCSCLPTATPSLYRLSMRTAAALVLAFTAASVCSQSYPVKPVRIIVPYAPGANADLIARLVSPIVADVGTTGAS
jgi:tripartite-type tricarboxylate transporter receptor subunit TctC